MRNVAVIGADGFLGTYVRFEFADRQALGEDVGGIGLDLPDFDVRWPKEILLNILAERQVDGIINLAGLLGTHELFDNVEQAIKVNIKGQYSVAWAATQMEIPYVTIEQPHVWTNPYETTRGAGIRLARGLATHQGLRLATVQAFNAFGPGQAYGPGHPQKIVPTLSVHAWNKAPLPIYGSGAQYVNLVHAKDIAAILVSALSHADTNPPHFYGAARGGNMTVNKVASMVQRFVQGQDWIDTSERLEMRAGEDDDDLGASMPELQLGEQGKLLGVHPRFRIQDFNKTVESYEGVPLA